MQQNIVLPNAPNYKKTISTYIIQSVVVIAMFIFALVKSDSYYSLLPYIKEGQELMKLVTGGNLNFIFYGVIPIIFASIFYLLWTIYYRYTLSSVFRTMSVLGQEFDVEKARTVMSIVMAVGLVAIALTNIILLRFPTVFMIGFPVIKAVIKAMIIAFSILPIAIKQEKIYRPVVIGGMIIPSIAIAIIL